ncbi:MAG TPA: cytochrome c biogenesis protein CcsA [Gemmataceae bacterium]|nr:cytochrome c biogenesis protein CcsA [Gemmataceae bacterium]
MKTFERFFPFGILAVAVLMLAGKFFGAPAGRVREMSLYEAGRLPVQHGGRVQPLDSFARNSLTIISGKQEVEEIIPGPEKKVVTRSAMEWLLDVWSRSAKADNYRIFRIEHPQVLRLLKLDDRPGSYRYSWAEVSASHDLLIARVDSASRKDREQRSLEEAKLVELGSHYKLYFEIRNRQKPGFIPAPDDAKWTTYEDVLHAAAEKFGPAARADAARAVQAEMDSRPETFTLLIKKHIGDESILEQARRKPDGEEKVREFVFTEEVRERTAKAVRDQMIDQLPQTFPVAAHLEAVLDAYRRDDAGAFDTAVAAYHTAVAPELPAGQVSRVATESRTNAFDPFLQCSVLYIGVAVFAALSWLVWQKPLNRAAFYLACVTLVVHTAALAARMYIGNRPPVTNLYSSAVFIGWGGLLLCITLENWYRNGVGTFVAGFLGFATVRIARFLGASGDTLEMLQAVLDTNLWLSTHVTIVSLGYVATFVAGLIAFVYIGRGMFTTQLRGEEGRRISGMIYGVICFATLLSFVGTVLGGIWADQSWGRFWGWDPKENGAVLIVIWNSLILHARWGGLVKARGMAVLAVLGNMVCAWSWFGTNQLGIGLHAYGFDNRLATGCAVFWIFNLMVAALGLVPLRFWASFGPEPAKA